MGTTLTSQELIETLNDDQSLARIYQKLLPSLKHHVMNNSGSPDDAKDLFQESMMITYRKAIGGNLELTSSLETFIYAVAKRRWLYELRQRKTTESLEVNNPEDGSNKIDEWIINEEQIKLYEKHLNKLSKGCRELMELFFQRLSMEEIANQLSINSVGYARKKKHECQEKLLKMIKSDPLYNELRIG